MKINRSSFLDPGQTNTDNWLGRWQLFAVFISMLVLDRILTLINFSFRYTDIDQTILWNGAVDYSKGIFHEPFFYGQAYNYMLEALMSVPLLWMKVPVYFALPISTSFISLLPFIVLAYFFKRKGHNIWAYLCLAFPVLLPLEYGFLTSIPRGFVQAHLFVPLLFFSLFNPKSNQRIGLFFLAAALCYVTNRSSLLLVAPLFVLVFIHHYKSPSFYLKSLWIVPILVADYFAKYFYQIHPEKVRHVLAGVHVDSDTFISSIENSGHFENLFPFFSHWGSVYPILFIALSVLAWKKSKKKEFLFILSILVLLLVTLAIPKIQSPYADAGIFYTPSRFYLLLPLLLIISAFMVFKKFEANRMTILALLIITGSTFVFKILKSQETSEYIFEKTVFPVAKNQDLLQRAHELENVVSNHNIDLVINASRNGVNYLFDTYAFYPLVQFNTSNSKMKEVISVSINGDRRSWLYYPSIPCEVILLNGVRFDKTKLKDFDHEVLNKHQVVIYNNPLGIYELCSQLDLHYGDPRLRLTK